MAKPVVKEIIERDEFTGRFEAVGSVEIRARVGGYLETAQFTEGSLVKQGDTLFIIDRRTFRASLAQAEAGIVSARTTLELARVELDRAERLQPVLNCFVTLVPEQAMAAARAAENAVTQGRTLGLLHGIPFAAKDLVNTAGVRTTFGSLLHAENVPAEDAVAAARMKAAGAILFGKTTTPEFGHKALTDAPLFGRTRNAWSAERTSGGSSGGAGADGTASMSEVDLRHRERLHDPAGGAQTWADDPAGYGLGRGRTEHDRLGQRQRADRARCAAPRCRGA